MKKHRRYLAVSATVTSVNSLRDQYPTLSGLFACYLHQDWTDEFPDAETALAEGIASMSPGERAQAGEDMDRLLQMTPSEELAKKAVVQLCPDYSPPDDGYTWLGWLTKVRRMVE